MGSIVQHFKGFSIIKGDIKVDVKLDRFSKQYKRAQFWLDSQVMTDMLPFMPHLTGTFQAVTRAQSAALAGTGKVVAGASPQGRYLYEGKVMVDKKTGKGPRKIPGVGLRFKKGAKLIATDRPLTYSNPRATPYWFDTAKNKNLKPWVKGVKREAGGG